MNSLLSVTLTIALTVLPAAAEMPGELFPDVPWETDAPTTTKPSTKKPPDGSKRTSGKLAGERTETPWFLTDASLIEMYRRVETGDPTVTADLRKEAAARKEAEQKEECLLVCGIAELRFGNMKAAVKEFRGLLVAKTKAIARVAGCYLYLIENCPEKQRASLASYKVFREECHKAADAEIARGDRLFEKVGKAPLGSNEQWAEVWEGFQKAWRAFEQAERLNQAAEVDERFIAMEKFAPKLAPQGMRVYSRRLAIRRNDLVRAVKLLQHNKGGGYGPPEGLKQVREIALDIRRTKDDAEWLLSMAWPDGPPNKAFGIMRNRIASADVIELSRNKENRNLAGRLAALFREIEQKPTIVLGKSVEPATRVFHLICEGPVWQNTEG